MKKIKIQQVISPNKKSHYIKDHYYCIYLGEQKFCYFNNEVKALRFLADTNRFYNTLLHESNNFYSQLFFEYRLIWFFIDENICHKLLTLFSEVDKNLNQVVLKCSHPANGNPLTFQYLTRVLTSLLNIAIILRNENERKDNYHITQKIDTIINIVHYNIKKLTDWGKSYDGLIEGIK